MNVFTDLIILLIAGSTVFLAGKRGFITTAVNTLGSLLALMAVFCFTEAVFQLLSMTPLSDLLSPAGVKAVAVVAIFLLVLLLLSVCGKALTNLVKKLPFVQKANTLLGLLLGFLTNFFCIACALLHGDIKLCFAFSAKQLPLLLAYRSCAA